jgi:hypothetical protein
MPLSTMQGLPPRAATAAPKWATVSAVDTDLAGYLRQSIAISSAVMDVVKRHAERLDQGDI